MYRQKQGKKKIYFPHCPFELSANYHSGFGPSKLCWLADNSKGHSEKSFFFSFLAFAYVFLFVVGPEPYSPVMGCPFVEI